MNGSVEAQQLLRQALVVDGLNASRLTERYLRRLRKAGITAVNHTVALRHNLSEAMKAIASLRHRIARVPFARLVRSAADLEQCQREAMVGVILGFQDVAPLEQDVRHVPLFWDVGIRIIQLSYHFRSTAADGAAERGDAGLSAFGRELVRVLNDTGIVIDLSHVGDRATLEAIEQSRHPVVMSHANSYSLAPVYQNKSDELIKALAKKGGVIGITAFPRLLAKDNPTLHDMLDHIDHVAGLVGTEHIGIATDFVEGWTSDSAGRALLLEIDGRIYTWPQGLRRVEDIPNLVEGLLRRGYSDEQVRGILGYNFYRVFKAVWGN